MISRGRVNFILEGLDIVYKSYLKTSYIGEIEILQDCNRLDTAVSFGHTEYQVLEKGDFDQIMEEFPKQKAEIAKIAE